MTKYAVLRVLRVVVRCRIPGYLGHPDLGTRFPYSGLRIPDSVFQILISGIQRTVYRSEVRGPWATPVGRTSYYVLGPNHLINLVGVKTESGRGPD